MTWQRYRRYGGSGAPGPAVRFHKTGQAVFNAAARRKFDLPTFSFIVLFFDRAKGLMGFEPTNDPAAEGMALTHNGHASWVFCRGFLSRFGQKPRLYHNYPLRLSSTRPTISLAENIKS